MKEEDVALQGADVAADWALCCTALQTSVLPFETCVLSPAGPSSTQAQTINWIQLRVAGAET